MKEFLLTAKQLDDLQVEMFAAGGFDRKAAREIALRSWPCTGDLLAVRLTMAGYAVTADDLIAYFCDPQTVVSTRGGNPLFHKADFTALARRLFDAKRFTPAALDRMEKGIAATADAARVEAEGERMLQEAQAYAERN